MHKRKNIGIIKYGPRLSKGISIQKFQTGGAASVASGYEWREDPYELMLMRQKSEGLESKRKAAAKSRSSAKAAPKDPKIGSFDVLEGGLNGTRKVLNAQYKALQQQYMNLVSANPPGWVSSHDSQQKFQQVVTTGKEFQEILKREQKQFTDAKANLNSSDSEALAISSTGKLMVANRHTKAYEFIYMDKYLDEIETYEPQTLRTFMHWKENYDTSGANEDTRLINEFMVNSAISPEEVTKKYVTPHINSISYKELNGFIVPQGEEAEQGFNKNNPIGDINNWRKTISGAINGTPPKDVNEKARTSILDAAKVIYRDILNGITDDSKLLASLQAEVLRDIGHRQKIASLGTKEEKAQYLNNQSQLALINKLYSKGSGSTTTTTSTGGSGKGDSNAYIAGIYRLEEGDNHSAYVYGQDFMTGDEMDKRRVADVITPKVNGIAKNGHLNLVTDPAVAKKSGTTQNTITGNTFMNTYTNTDNIYLENGMSLNKKLGSGPASSFVKESMRIDPSTDVDLVYIFMDAKGNITMNEGEDLAKQKLKNRASFITAYNKHLMPGMERLTAKPEDMLPGGSGEQAQRAYRLFQAWADSSTELDVLAADVRKEPGNQDAMRRWEMSKAAVQMREDTEGLIRSLKTKHLVPMAKITVLIDNDDIDLFDMAEAYSKATNYGEGLQKGGVSSDDEKYMQEINNVDHRNLLKNWNMPGLNPIGDNVYKATILVPMSDMGSIATGYGITKGAKIEELSTYNNIENAANSVINMGSAITNPGNVEALSKFIRE